MPIYLVRWPDLSASFVQAEGEAHLLDILDQVGNPDDCEWSIYDGPVFIDFRLPVEWTVQGDRHGVPVVPEQIAVGDMGRLASGNVVEAMELSLAAADDGYETGAEVVRRAFPKLHALIERRSETGGELDGEAALPEAELRQALHAELERFLRGSWRRAKLERKTDGISRLAREMDLSIELARTYEEIARKQQSVGGGQRIKCLQISRDCRIDPHGSAKRSVRKGSSENDAGSSATRKSLLLRGISELQQWK